MGDLGLALVTGGSRGIGRATALRLAADGYDVAFCYRSDSAAAREVADAVEDLGREVYARRADVAQPQQVRDFVDGAEDALGPTSVLVASAALVRDAPLTLLEQSDWDGVLRTNLDGVFHVCRCVVGGMVSRRRGAVVTLSSLAGTRGNAGQCAYAASKAGIVGFTRSLAREVGPYGVRANAVVPGYVLTDQLDRLPPRVLDEACAAVALRRPGRPEEVADLVSYLVSSRASYITGTAVEIDGGHP